MKKLLYTLSILAITTVATQAQTADEVAAKQKRTRTERATKPATNNLETEDASNGNTKVDAKTQEILDQKRAEYEARKAAKKNGTVNTTDAANKKRSRKVVEAKNVTYKKNEVNQEANKKKRAEKQKVEDELNPKKGSN